MLLVITSDAFLSR